LGRLNLKKNIKLNEIVDLGAKVEEVTIENWYKKEGDLINKDEQLVDILAEKVTFEVSSPYNGKISKIFFQEGEEVSKNEIIVEIEVKE
jgi:pyruvate dehydrogenase E2 component (dihydrolipoamide acetyltransferase)